MEFGLLQCTRKVGDKVANLSRTQIMKFGDVIYVADFHDLCPQQVRDDFVGNLSRTLSQSRRNGIWALAMKLTLTMLHPRNSHHAQHNRQLKQNRNVTDVKKGKGHQFV